MLRLIIMFKVYFEQHLKLYYTQRKIHSLILLGLIYEYHNII